MRHFDRPRSRRLVTVFIGSLCVAWGAGAQAQTSGGSPPARNIEGPSPPVPFEAVRPGPPAPLSPAAAPSLDNLPDLSAVSTWAIPPIRWGGNTTSNYSWNSSADAKNFNESQTVNLRASSYVYQPWYAQVSGDVGLLTGSSRQDGGQSAGTSSRNTSLTYGGNLNLFPQSRFPFQAFVQTSDSRASANAIGAHYTAMRMGARQSYRPEKGSEHYAGSADRSIVTSGGVHSIVDALQGNFGTSLGDHSFNGNARYSRNSGDVAGQGSNLLSIGGSHAWRSDEELTVASSANYSNNQIRMLNGTGLAVNNSQIMQLGSAVTWLPDEELPLTIVGGGSLLQMSTVTETGRAQLGSFSGYANANYRFSENLTGMAGATLAQSQANGIRQVASGQTAALSYSGTPLRFGDYSYNWGSSGSFSNQTISGGGSNRSIGGNVQHSVLRDVTLSEASAITFNVSQSIGLTTTGTSGQSSVLTHSGGANWRLRVDDRTAGMLSTTVSDTMSRGAFESHYRSLSANGNVQAQISRRSALTGALNFVVSQQLATPTITQTVVPDPANPTITQPISNGSTTMNGSGQLGYTHRSPFDISNLVYSATVQASASQTNLRLVSGDANALGWQTGNVFQHSADYRLGRLMFRATNSFATLNGKKNASVFIMVGRELGDF